MALECGGRKTEVVSGIDGAFAFESSGEGCTVEVSKEGFETSVMPVERTAEPLLIMLGIAEVRQQLTVTGDAEQLSVSPAENLDTIEVDAETLDSLPVMDQDYIGFMAGFLADGMIGSAGYSLVVDGIEIDDAGVSSSAIQEVKINKNPYSAEFYSPGRGRLEVTTRKGTEAFHGSFTFLWRDHRLYARNAFATVRPPEGRQVWEGHLTGPLSKDGRTSFLLSAAYERDNEWATVYARTPGGVVNDQVFQPEREKEFSFRVSRLIGESQSLSVRYEYETETEKNNGPGGFTLPETAFDSYGREHQILLTHRSVIRNRLLNEMRVEFEDERERTESALAGEARIVVLDAFTAGGAQRDHAEKEHGFEFGNIVSWNAGNHYFRTGITLDDLSRTDFIDQTGRDGTYRFASNADYLAGNPFSFEQTTGEGRASFWNARLATFLQDDWRVRSDLSLALGVRYEYHAWPHGESNVAPRFSIAYAPGTDRRTVFRAGGGVFYDRFGTSTVLSTLLNDGVRLREVQLPDPEYPIQWGAIRPGSALPANIVRFAPDLGSPLLLNYSAGVERTLWTKTVLSISYQGIRGLGLFRSTDRNTPLPPDFQRPDPAVATLQEIESSGRQRGHSLDVSVRGRLGSSFSGGVIYTLGRTMNDTGGVNWMPADPQDLSGEWARASFDRTHRFRSFGVLNVWKLFDVGVVFSAYSGNPYSITTGRDDNRDGRATDRPDGIPRNSETEFGRVDLDLRLAREFTIGLRRGSDAQPKLQFAVDAFNAVNRVNYDQVTGNIRSPLFGQPVSARSPRRIQLSLRLKF